MNMKKNTATGNSPLTHKNAAKSKGMGVLPSCFFVWAHFHRYVPKTGLCDLSVAFCAAKRRKELPSCAVGFMRLSPWNPPYVSCNVKLLYKARCLKTKT
jgi:hypothetical protein